MLHLLLLSVVLSHCAPGTPTHLSCAPARGQPRQPRCVLPLGPSLGSRAAVTAGGFQHVLCGSLSFPVEVGAFSGRVVFISL